ncbi:MAG: efflux RND transporter periplasmic adaptor subunit [Pseudomonadales bacterium]|nr:efflux RND transporter periplasmic adaptor subunit [Pseudomonadales bacterium]
MTASVPTRKPCFRLLALSLLALLAVACSNDNTGQGNRFGAGQQMPNIPAVEAVRAQIGSLPLEERLTGRVTALNQTEIYPEVAGIIVEIFAKNGDFVNAGDPLVRLRSAEYEERYQQAASGLEIAKAQTRQAQANLELLQSQLRRTQELLDRKLETRSNLETIQSQVAVAEADLDLRKAQEKQANSLAEERRLQMTNTTIRAPISGTVGQRNAEIGQLATTANRLFILGNLDQMQVELLLTERMMNYIKEGMTVNLYSDNWPDTVLQSRITRISPFLDPATMRTQAQVEIQNPGGRILPGMFLTVDVLYGESEQAVLIPNSALYRHPRTGIEGVYVVRAPGTELSPLSENAETAPTSPPLPVSFVPIEIVANGRMASGVTGINNGDWVVTIGQNLLIGDTSQAKARLLPWDHMLELQRIQSQDLLELIDKQRQATSTDDT